MAMTPPTAAKEMAPIAQGLDQFTPSSAKWAWGSFV
eukprot:CAMPEP_0175103144 /NCGR_PEP_ID=MMETSP0086_2-20121207/8892_1 /TAXON_ID=136419 /ORGANISM="Unknown Unknown, Strain D1" /LENGTH=35 /DNA_ID= /DNA_START= /DNA_END= /DNA_ORIENTATION=